MYGYIYKTTCLVNNKIYIGQHKKSYFDNKYYGSGNKICKAINAYGIENFKCEILCKCDSLDELNRKEIYYIDLFNSTNGEIGYNITLGGNQISTTPEIANKISKAQIERFKDPILGKYLRENLSLIHKGKTLSEDHKIKLKKANTGRIHSKEERERIRKSLIGHVGCTHSKETIEKLRKDSHERHWYNNGIEEVFQKTCPEGFKIGRLNFSNSWKNNISKSVVKREVSEETKQKIREKALGNKSNSGRITINKNNQNKFIFPKDLEKYLAIGYKLGGKKRKI